MADRKKDTQSSKARKPVKKQAKKVKSDAVNKKISAKADTIVKKGITVKKKAAVKKKATAAKANTTRKKKSNATGKSVNNSFSANDILDGIRIAISADDRHQMICKAAYLLSIKRQPDVGCQVQDWLQAETIIDMCFETS